MYEWINNRTTKVQMIHYWFDVVVTFVSLSLPILIARLLAESRPDYCLSCFRGYFPITILMIGVVIYMIGLVGIIQMIRHRSLFALAAVIWIIVQLFGGFYKEFIGAEVAVVIVVVGGGALLFLGAVFISFLPAMIFWKWRRNRWYAVGLVPGIIFWSLVLMFVAWWPYMLFE